MYTLMGLTIKRSKKGEYRGRGLRREGRGWITVEMSDVEVPVEQFLPLTKSGCGHSQKLAWAGRRQGRGNRGS